MNNIICITPIKHIEGVLDQLKLKGNVTYAPEINKKQLKEILERKKNINCIFCNPNMQSFILDYKLLKNTGIRVINTASTGTNHIDLNACKKLNIKVLSLKNDKKLIYQLPSTSELAFCLMIAMLKNLVSSYESVKKKQWRYIDFMGQELASLRVGIIGYGRLGKFMSKYCNAFGMKVYVYDKFKKSKKFQNKTLKGIFRNCDVISLHIHLDENTRELINLKLLKESNNKPILINTSRGNIVNESDVLIALKKNILKGYATDVLTDELNNIKNSELLKNTNKNNILITPHIGGMTHQGQKRAYLWAVNKF